MDKIKINNQVVCMRKFVKQGKIRIINKFVKEIQLLRNRKGGEQKVAKCQRKADRLLEEVAILKKIKPDTVSRMALTKSKDWKAVLSQKGVSPEDRCFALLASYGPVQEEVEKFYSENSYLTFKIPTLVQEWEEKNLTPQKNKNSFKLNSRSNEGTKRDPPHSKKENKSTEVKSGEQSSEPRKQSAMLKDEDDCGALKARGLEDMMVDDSENEGTKDTKSGHCEVSNGNQDSDDNEEDGEEESDGEEEESDDNEEIREDNLENKKDDLENSEDDEDSDDQEGSDESYMHSDDEKVTNVSDNDLKNKSKASSIKVSKMKSKPAKNDSNILPSSPVKTANDFKNKIPSLQKNVPLDSNSTKAVALVNLNELMDMDEIPIVGSKTDEKDASELKKRKKDSFFLKDGEEFSESDQSEDEDSNDDDDDDGTFKNKNAHRNSFNKKSSVAHQGRTKMEDNSRNFRNKGFQNNAPHDKKFEKGDQKFRNDPHFKQKFNRFDKNDRKPYSESQKFNRFDKNDRKPYSETQKFNRFDKNDRKPYSESQKFNRFDRKSHSDQQNFKHNKWNRGDEGDRKGSKPFSNFQEKKQTYSKNKPDNHPRNDFGKTVKKDEPPLHPSWEAKRKLKQATNTKFQGKRMVFDD